MPEQEEVLHHLSGWRNSAPVRLGNAAHGQEQFDIYGEFLNSLCTYLEAVREACGDEPGQLAAKAIRTLTAQVIARLDQPDRGVWEIRGEPEHMLHSKGMLWLALDRAARIAELLDHPPGSDAAGWRARAEALRAEYLERGWNAERGCYVQSYGSDILDASAMRLVLYGAIPPDSPRMLATLDAVERELTQGELVYRYRGMADEFAGKEGAFLACGFWLAGCRALAGQTRRAVSLFERLLARGSDLGALRRGDGPGHRRAAGNYPQGFTHMAVVQCALRIEDCVERFGMR